MNKVKAICIKQYIDEDSLEDYNSGEISFEELKHYKKGKEYYVYKKYYNDKYYKLLSDN